MKLIRRPVSEVVLPVTAATIRVPIRPGYLNGSPVNDVCVLQELRAALIYAWDRTNRALFGSTDFSEATRLLRSVLQDVFAITVTIDADTRTLVGQLEGLLALIEGVKSTDDPRQTRKALINAINRTKKALKAVEVKTVEPSPVKRVFKRLFGDLALQITPPDLEQGRQLARTALRGMSDEIADRLRVDESVRQALRLFNLNVWSTHEEFRARRAELLKKHHPDHGGDAETFQQFHGQAKVLDAYFVERPVQDKQVS